MTYDKALKLAIKQLQKEKRRCRQFYDLFNAGFVHEEPGAKKYIELDEAISTLEMLHSELDNLSASVLIQETIEKLLNGIH